MSAIKPTLQPALQRIPASVFGDHLAAERDCLGFNVKTLPTFARSRIPALHDEHWFSASDYRTISLWWALANNEPLYISGPSGAGKTSTALQFCARLGMPVVSVTARARMDRRELIGHWAVKGGETVWIDGPALLAWKYGWVLLINEFSAAPADMWVSCNDILEGLPIDVNATGDVVPRHPMTRVIVTDNTRGHASDIEEGFFGRQIQDRSVIDRFWHHRMEGLREDEEAALLARTAPEALTTGFDEERLTRLYRALAHMGADSRAASRTRAVGFETHAVPLSHRVLSRLRDMLLDAAGQPFDPADDIVRRLMRTALAEALDATAREAAEALAVTTIGDLVPQLRKSRALNAVPGIRTAA